MYIDKIQITNFCGIAERTFEFLSPFTVIIGDNGVGKTSILEALSVAAGCFTIPTANANRQRKILKSEVRRVATQEIVFEYAFPCVVKAWQGNISWSRSVNDLRFRNSNEDALPLSNIARSQIKRLESPDVILPVFAYHGTGRLWNEMNDVDFVPQGSRLEGYDNCFSAKTSSKDFRKWYKTLERTESQKRSDIISSRLRIFREAVMSCIEDWDDMHFDFSENDIVLTQHKDGVDNYMPFMQLSDGYRTMFALVADIAYRCIRLNPSLGADAIRRTPGLVLIDEIDMHLHPIWQKRIVSELSRCFESIQFIATTHSPFIVQSLKANQVINLGMEQLQHDPDRRSLEESALFMGVESDRSIEMSEKEKAAERFFKLLQTPSGERVEDPERIINDYMERYSDDPAYIAMLKLQMITSGR